MEKEFLRTIQECQKIISRICNLYRDTKQDQEDLFQEIVFQLWKSYPGFKGESKVSSWIYRIALNTAIVVYRKPGLAIKYYGEIPEHLHPSSEKTRSGNEETLFNALRKLSDAEKGIISLYLDDFSYREISDITGISEGNVGVRLNRIKNRLKQLIK